ncbi:NAD(P)-dependent dehydrogenase (short-subunit alcohol dehydrogenase family) [Novosphingobium hassiacum]|uniref:NAD(P)-dependent dehydrogenase (Short-subunit alcohol dehydrogenase family) n=1 Tax=Novosphingobium hassiacum TaxID=173676 RepID=A0A7W5ZWU6_9SPHN|nr:SDR family oxidoreductase [Novosphingobium hassiacum]MBB3860936.1 NAD(P)-dependent dehydrogenase (short-subunit alcohol dehydrogenase family) [Novosphingobium hassiacum]
MIDVLKNFRLDGKTALVVGGGPGIGSSVARAYAQIGANVVVSARSGDRMEQLAKEIREDGGNAIGVASDAGRKEDLEALVEQARKEYGPIHVLFFNAYVGPLPIDADLFSTSDEHFEAAFNLNMLTPFRLAKMLVPDMKKEGYGSIINLLTCAAFTPILPQISYGSTKAGLHMLTRYLAKAVGPDVRANCICPGSTSADGITRPAFAEHVAKNAIARTGHADEAIGAAVLLASPASTYTTGQCIFVEGGRVSTIS